MDLAGDLALGTQLAAALDQRTHLAGDLGLGTQLAAALDQRTHLVGSVSQTMTVRDALLAVFGLAVVSPADASTVVSSTPKFVVTVTTSPSAPSPTVVRIQVDTDPAFPTPTVLTATPDLVLGSNRVVLNTTIPLTPQTYFWRIRLEPPGSTGPWLPTRSFTAVVTLDYDTTITTTVVAGSSAPPHLWHVRPDAGHQGDTVTAYGHGLGSTPSVTVAGVPATVTASRLVADTGTVTGRVINPTTGHADAEHYEVVFTVPAVAPPGGPLTVGS